MASTPEGRVKAAIKAFLKTLPNCWWFMPVSNGMGAHGVPDFIVCYKGVFLAIEAKAPGREGSTTPLQERTLKDITYAHGYAMVAADVRVVQATIRAIDAAIEHRLSPQDTDKLVGIYRKFALAA